MVVDVVINGAGPNGLMLAGELALAGVNPVVLERLPEPSELPRANGLVGQVVPALDHRGLLDVLAGQTAFVGPVPQFQFGGLPIDLTRLGTSPLHVLAIPQRRLERLLGERAEELGADIRRGHELTGLRQDGDGVTLDVRTSEGGYQLRARYLVGCDGAHSLVRKQAGIEFPGTTGREVVRIGRVTVAGSAIVPGTRELEVPGTGRLALFRPNRTAHGAITVAPLSDLDPDAATDVYIISSQEEQEAPADPHAPMDLTELRDSVRRVLGADLPIDRPQWLSRTIGNSRLAQRYRMGRVLLAGDAAHLFSAGGSALNVGLLDAVNLGWKLAAQVRGWAPDGLLDSYHTERHAVGERVLLRTRAQAALSGPGEDRAALRELVAELLDYEQPLRHVAEALEGSDVRYDMPGAGAVAHPLVGRWVPDLALRTAAGPTRVAELMRAARPVLLDLTAGSPVDSPAGSSIGSTAGPSIGSTAGSTALETTTNGGIAATAAGWGDRVSVVAAHPATGPAPAAGLLIRPDGYVAWAAATGSPRPTDGLRDALTAWFGTAN
jgi:2-polyprenyl-6-methoxyphenol hydroxylase-like FAD-dependent oxidoreductase